MKKAIVGFIAGALLAGSTAYGAAEWRSDGRTYSCTGSSVSVFCKETNWSGGVFTVALYPGAATLAYKGKIIATCKRKVQPSGQSCFYRYQYGG